MGAVAKAINDPHDGIQSCVEMWRRRRDVLLDELQDFTVIPPHGGWSFLVDVSALGLDSSVSPATCGSSRLSVDSILTIEG